MDPPDNIIALSRYRARLGRGKRMRRIDAVMALPNPEQAIRALPGDELYYLLREDDPREAKELLAYARPEQVQVVLDFGLWSGNQLVPERMEEWVDVMAEMPFETIGEWIRGLGHRAGRASDSQGRPGLRSGDRRSARRARGHVLSDPGSFVRSGCRRLRGAIGRRIATRP